MNRLIKPLTIIIIAVLIFTQADGYKLGISTVQAVGDLAIDWGVPSGNPIFSESNVLPGDSFSHSIDVTNNASEDRYVGVQGVKTTGIGDLAKNFDFVISENGSDLYGGANPGGAKTLWDFFNESDNILGIPLSNLTPSSTTTYTFMATLQDPAGNDVSEEELIFNIIIGTTIEIPSECTMNFDGEAVEGTEGRDRLRGTSKNDFIFARGGNDRIWGGGGNDCIIGGAGADRIDGGGGNDVLFGKGGKDRIKGGSGTDLIFGGGGKDKLYGGSGDDEVYGQGGNDSLKGGGGNDSLQGGAGYDSLNGNSGIDACNGEKEKNCEI